MNIYIYTDGSSSNNKTRCGGWCAVLLAFEDGKDDPIKKVILSGGAKETTNIRMELTAVINGLKALTRPSKVTVVTDLELICKTMQLGWKRKAPELHPLWQEIDRLAAIHEIEWAWIKGHSGKKWNEYADQLAVKARSEIEQSMI